MEIKIVEVLRHAARLLRENAESLRECHTVEGCDWTGEDEAKAVYDDETRTADQLDALAARRTWPDGLLDRIDAASRRIQNGHSPRRIPADPTDVDLVLAEVTLLLRGKAPPSWLDDIQTAPLDLSPATCRARSDAMQDVLAERQRQIAVKGWTPEHDDEYKKGELAFAAISYAWPPEYRAADGSPPIRWPWSRASWNPNGIW